MTLLTAFTASLALLVATPDAGTPNLSLRQRSIELSQDGAPPEVVAAPGTPLTLAFPEVIDPDAVFLADPASAFHEPKTLGRHVLLIPKVEAKPNAAATLTAATAGGDIFLVAVRIGDREPADARVELVRRGAQKPDAATSAKRDAPSESSDESLAVLSQLTLAAETHPNPHGLARREAHFVDRDGQVHCRLVSAYRGFGALVLVFRLDNRDPGHPFEPSQVTATGSDGKASSELSASFSAEPRSLASGEQGFLSVALGAAEQATAVSLTLTDASGRTVRLEGVTP